MFFFKLKENQKPNCLSSPFFRLLTFPSPKTKNWAKRSKNCLLLLQRPLERICQIPPFPLPYSAHKRIHHWLFVAAHTQIFSVSAGRKGTPAKNGSTGSLGPHPIMVIMLNGGLKKWLYGELPPPWIFHVCAGFEASSQ